MKLTGWRTFIFTLLLFHSLLTAFLITAEDIEEDGLLTSAENAAESSPSSPDDSQPEIATNEVEEGSGTIEASDEVAPDKAADTEEVSVEEGIQEGSGSADEVTTSTPDSDSATISPDDDCSKTDFSCCPDGRTPAAGPRFEGCSCSTSPFGCCTPNDVSSGLKLGPEGQGCPGGPDLDTELASQVCGLPKERGSCQNYTVKWYFDTTYGACLRFWYSGCDGNGNRFDSKGDCDSICVSPTRSEDICQLPQVRGACNGNYQSWTYDRERGVCREFDYSGCLGNKNRFDSRDACDEMCGSGSEGSSGNKCHHRPEQGPCRGNFVRWYYDPSMGRCKLFRYGGCRGNKNNFMSEPECRQSCAPDPRDVCTQPMTEGPCLGQFPRWYFNTLKGDCEHFIYTGCQGNKNRFVDRESCQRTCSALMSTRPGLAGARPGGQDACLLQFETGNCVNYTQRWYYDAARGRCARFYYSGCGGNQNNYATWQECRATCEGTTVAVSTTPAPVPSSESCTMDYDRGPCNRYEIQYYYDKSDGVCKEFYWGGCEGNSNRFASRKECERVCWNSQSICNLPKVVGPCSGKFPQWFYDSSDDSCHTFIYGGCQGNANRFSSQSECDSHCKKGASENELEISGRSRDESRSKCFLQPETGPCKQYLHKWAYSPAGHCRPFVYGGCGGNANRFDTQIECEAHCQIEDDYGSAQDNEVPEPDQSTDVAERDRICTLPVDSGDVTNCTFPETRARYFYDPAAGTCIPFVYNGNCPSPGNQNKFKTYEKCIRFCYGVTAPAVQPFPLEPGPDLDSSLTLTTSTTTTTTPRTTTTTEYDQWKDPDLYRKELKLENCQDSPNFANCKLIVHHNYCRNAYYVRFCCRSCYAAGQIVLPSK